MKFGIIGAMDCEIEIFKEKTSEIKEAHYAGLVFYEGKINGSSVVLVKSGMGKVNAASCTQIVIDKFEVTHIINTGVAGGLDKRLHIFDVVISSECVYHDVDTTFFGDAPCTLPEMPTFFPADEKLVKVAQKIGEEENGSKVFLGRIATGDQFVCTLEGKNKIIENCNPMCVEMEGTAIAHVCYRNKIPFVIIRTISDNADESEDNKYGFNKFDAAKISGRLVCSILDEFKGE